MTEKKIYSKELEINNNKELKRDNTEDPSIEKKGSIIPIQHQYNIYVYVNSYGRYSNLKEKEKAKKNYLNKFSKIREKNPNKKKRDN